MVSIFPISSSSSLDKELMSTSIFLNSFLILLYVSKQWKISFSLLSILAPSSVSISSLIAFFIILRILIESLNLIISTILYFSFSSSFLPFIIRLLRSLSTLNSCAVYEAADARNSSLYTEHFPINFSNKFSSVLYVPSSFNCVV